MNINNIGTALFSDFSSTTAVGDSQNTVAGQPGKSEGSLFQLMITQMMKGKVQPESAVDNEGDGSPGKSNGIGGDLSALISGGTLAEIRKLNFSGDLFEGFEGNGKSFQVDSAEEDSTAIDALQALMGGLTDAFPASKIVRVLQENRNGNQADEQADLSAGSGVIGASTTVELENDLQSTAASNSLDKNVLPVYGKADLQSGIPGLAEQYPNSQFGDMNRIAAAAPADEGTTVSFGTAARPQDIGNQFEVENQIKAVAIGTSDTAAGAETVDAGAQNLGSIAGNNQTQQTEIDVLGQSQIASHYSVQGTTPTGETAALSQASQSAEASEPYSQIRDEILAKLEQKGPTEFKMQLKPEELGQIDIKLKLSEGRLIIDIMAANAKTQALLTGQVDKLIAVMGLQNVLVESVQVNQQMNGQTQDNSQSQAFMMNSAMDFSQKRNQEQFTQQFSSEGSSKPNHAAGSRPDAGIIENPVNPAGPGRYDSHRMNYTV